MNISPENSINLQLGDIIEIFSPDNDDINNIQFFIDYIDNENIKLININNNSIKLLNIIDGNFEIDIESISLLDRAESPSYARQNNLLINTWINIYFNTDEPFILTGQIINLEEDMIEVKSKNNDIIYIDFEYKGLPKNLPISKIEIRDQPLTSKTKITPLKEDKEELTEDKEELTEDKEELTEDKEELTEDKEKLYQDEYNISEKTNEQFKEIFIDADQINFGEELPEIIQLVDVDESQKRFSLEQQTNDLLDELLSNIPNIKRTNKVLNNIHLEIERFVQLRKIFSTFSNNGNVNKLNPISNTFKPLIDNLNNLSREIKWLIPVTTYKKNMYDINNITLESNENDDINALKYNEDLINIKQIIDNYTSNNFDGDNNKYYNLFQKLNNNYTPYIPPNISDNIINTQNVNTNLTTIINNLGDFESTVASNEESLLMNKKFLFDKYTLGFKNITNNDTLYIQSYLRLPLQFLIYSKINSSSELLYSKINLSKIDIDYNNILNNVNLINEVITDFDKKNLIKMKNNIVEYSLSPELLQEEEYYNKFLNYILPSNEELFNTLKYKFKNILSIKKIINELSTFSIYDNNINNYFFDILKKFTNENIEQYKKDMLFNLKKYSKLKKVDKYTNNDFFKKFITNKNIETILTDSYKLSLESKLNNSEIINIILNFDNGNLYSNIIVKINFDLQTNNLVETLVKKYETNVKTIQTLQNTDKCGSLTKMYNSIDELNNDNKKTILRDDDYSFNKDAKEEVLDNDYAILKVEENKYEYFKRENDVWVKDTIITETANNQLLENEDFCNLFQSCYLNNKSCINLDKTRDELEKETLTNIYKEFDNKYGNEESILKENIDKLIVESVQNIKLLKKIKNYENFKYNNLKNKIGDMLILEEDDKEIIKSPYEELRNIILSQNDFIKKQNDIQKFVLYFTREPYEDENKYWLYCNQTNTQLIPFFLKKLADVFLSDGDYLMEIDKICSEQGTISDDGNQWVDKYSGYFIKNIDYDTEEGYTEDGFKLKTREKLEQDLGDAVLEEIKDHDDTKKIIKDKEEIQMINNIINAMTNFMDINLKNYNEFIVTNSINLYDKLIPQIKKQFTVMQKKSQEKSTVMDISLKDNLDQNLLIITLSYLLVTIQISIPSVVSRKTFPGCIKSFTGYPITGTDKSAIQYIACVANKIKSSSRPWNSIKKAKESSIIKRIEALIDGDILKQQNIIEKVNKKLEFMKNEIVDDTILVTDFAKLNNFLPPLHKYKIQHFSNITETFKSKLFENIETGNIFQDQQIMIIKTKILTFGFLIQNKIQNIIEKNSPLLSSNSGKKFLENSCCDEENTNVHNFLLNNDSSIQTDNISVNELNKIIYNLKIVSEPPIFFDPTNTKINYIKPDITFSKKIIYKSFIVFCNDKSLRFSDEIKEICFKDIEFEENESIEKQIEKLQENGINYSNDMFEKLMELVNNKNTVHINLSNKNQSKIEKLREILNNLKDTDNNYIDEKFINYFISMLDTYSLNDKENDILRNFKNYIASENERLYKYIINFIKINYKLSKSKFKKFDTCLQNITSFKINLNKDDSTINNKDDVSFKMINFIKNLILQLTKYFPLIIKNNVNNSNINIPKHWKLSLRHTNDIKEIVNKYYLKLKEFYDKEGLSDHLDNAYNEIEYLIKLSDLTPFISTYMIDDTEVSSIFDRRFIELIYKYYLLKIMEIQIKYGDDDIESIEELQEQQEEAIVDDSEKSSKLVSSDILSLYYVNIFEIICNEKEIIDYNYESIMERVLRSKEKEKDDITEKLKLLSDDDRNVDNIFRTHKLGDWGKGLQKGLTQYDVDTYDDERDKLEKNMLKDIKLGKNTLVTDLNKEIYSLEMDENGIINEMIENEANNMIDYDDYDNMDDPEYGEDYYNNDGY